MRLIGEVNNIRLAESFCAWLTAEGIESHFESNGAMVQIWIKNEDYVGKAKVELENFLAAPNDAKYESAKARAADIRRDQQLRKKNFDRNVVQKTAVRGKIPLTITLVVICALVALFTGFGAIKESVWFRSLAFCDIDLTQNPEALDQGNITSSNTLKLWSIMHGEIWRLFTPMFIHFDGPHIIFNMVWLIQLGRVVEIRYGTFMFALFVLFSAATSNLIQVTVPEEWDGTKIGQVGNHLVLALGGMSGVCYALFGFVWTKSIVDPGSRLHMPQSTVIWMLGWMFFCMLPNSQAILGARIGNWAHGVGLVCGITVAYISTIMATKKP